MTGSFLTTVALSPLSEPTVLQAFVYRFVGLLGPKLIWFAWFLLLAALHGVPGQRREHWHVCHEL